MKFLKKAFRTLYFDKIHIVGGGGLAIIMIILFLRDGYYLSPDSEGYISRSPIREPLYPLFLGLLKVLAGETLYLYIAVFLQSVLALFCACFFVKQISKLFSFKGYISCFLYGMVALYYGLACIVISKWESAVMLQILTEAITYPLFLVYLVEIIIVLLNVKIETKKLLKISLLSFLICATRSGLAYIWILDFLVIFYIFIVNKSKLRMYCRGVLFLACAILLSILLEYSYMYYTFGHWSTRTGKNIAFLANVLCLADEADCISEDISDEVRNILVNTYQKMKEGGGLFNKEMYHLSPRKRIEFVSSAYSINRYNSFSTEVDRYCDALGIIDCYDRGVFEDKVASELVHVILPKKIDQWFLNYCSLVLNGYKNTVNVAVPEWLRVLDIYSWMLFGTNVLILWFKRRTIIIVKMELFAFVSTYGLIASTAMFVMPMARLCNYNFILAYLPILILVSNISFKGREKASGSEEATNNSYVLRE